MAFKNNVVQITTSDTLVTQMPANAEGAIHGLVICNNNIESRTVTLKLYKASSGVTSIIISGVTIAAKSQLTWPKPINLESNDILYASGADLVVLHSTYVGTAVPAAVGFTGRGAWSSSATYAANDIVSYNGNSYLANSTNTNSTPPSASWTLLSQKGDAGSLPGNSIRTPVASSPTTGGDTLPPNGPLVASTYAPIYQVDARNYREFQVTTSADTNFATPVFTTQVNADSTNISPNLSVATAYRWRCRDVAANGSVSDWMTVQSFTTKSLSVVTPTVTVTDSAVAGGQVGRAPTISTSAFATSPTSATTHTSTTWEVRKLSDNSLVWTSAADTANLTSIQVPANVLSVSTDYVFKAYHTSSLYGDSAFGSVGAKTVAAFPNLVYNPATVINENSFSVTQSQSLAYLTDDIALMGYTEYSTNTALSGQTLKLSIWKRTSGQFVEDATTITTISTDFRLNSIIAVVMLSSTLGFITYITSDNSVKSRAFNISAGPNYSILSVGTETTTVAVVTSGTSAFNIRVFRKADDVAAIAYCTMTSSGGGGIYDIRTTGLKFVNTAITVVNTVSFTQTSGWGGSSPYGNVPYIANYTGCGISPNGIIIPYVLYYTPGDYQYRGFFEMLVNSAGTVSAGNHIALPGNATNGFDSTTASCVILSNTDAIIFYRNPSTATSFSARFNPSALAAPTIITALSINLNSFNSGSYTTNIFLSKISTTSALMYIPGNSARIFTVTGSATLEGAAQIVQPQTGQSGTYSNNIIRISDLSSTNRFDVWSFAAQNISHYPLTISSGTVQTDVVKQIVTRGIANTYTSYNYRQTIAPLSASRAAVLTRDAYYVNSASLGRLSLVMYNTALNTPVAVNTTQLDISNPNTGAAALVAMSSSRVLLLIAGNLYLYSASDNAFTLLATGNLPVGSYYVSIVRLSSTSAMIFYYNNSTGGIQFALVNTTGDSISVGTAANVSLQDQTTSVIAEALSATRILCVYGTSNSDLRRAALILNNGTSWVVQQNDVVITSGGGGQSFAGLTALDSQRAVVAYQPDNSSGIIRTISTSGDTITLSATTATTTLSGQSNAQNLSIIALDNTNCIAGLQTSTGTSLYSFTVGTGAAAPAAPAKLTDLNTTLPLSVPALRLASMVPPGVGNQTSLQILTLERNAGNDASHNVLLRKFIRGTV
jgi:hypothetical protein